MADNFTVLVNRKKKATTRVELEKYTKDELIERLLQLEIHNQQLKNIIKKETSTVQESTSENHRKFDFKNCHRRHILLKFYYLGWDYAGFATQENSANTIEHHMFAALQKTCLIENRDTSNYHRCGRTDKGVSAFSQVISIDVRSKFPPDQQMLTESLANEIRYCENMNRVLPKDIRCVGWIPLSNPTYSARFDCRQRTYRYFFPRSNLDIDAMQKAARYLVGSHDFRNFCKMDVGNGVVAFDRQIQQAEIIAADGEFSVPSPYDMFYLKLSGKAFLWHQVRCIMAILFLVGQRNEQPEIVQQLFDVDANPCTPQYSLASDMALNLFNVEYDEFSTGTVSSAIPTASAEKLQWIYDDVNITRVIGVLQQHWTGFNVRAAMIKEMLKVLEDILQEQLKLAPVHQHVDALQEGVKSKQYQPLMSRIKCESLQNRIQHYAKKRRIELQPMDNGTSKQQHDDTMT